MLYTVGEAAKRLNTAPSTLRYYDREGLLPFVERSGSGIRLFKESDLEWLKIIGCLKRAGMPLKDIKAFIHLALQGDGTIDERLQMFLDQRASVQRQIEALRQTLAVLDFKCWYYEAAKARGSTDGLRSMAEADVPAQHRAVYRELRGEAE